MMRKTIENDFGKAVVFIVESDLYKSLNKCLDIVKELDKKDLNDEVEIIEDTPKEDKKINRVERKARNLTNQYIKEKLNEIIDMLNGEDNG